MAVTKVKTLTPLDQVAEVLGINPWAFNGFSIPEAQSHLEMDCAGTWFQQYSDKVTRVEFAHAIATAETKMRNYMGFNILPKYETLTLYPPTSNYSLKPNIQVKNRGYIVSIGSETKTLLGKFAITREDRDGDSFAEVGTIDLTAHSTIDVNEIKVYYPGTTLEIRPITIEDTGTTRKLVFQMYQVPKWSLINAFAPDPVDSDDVNSYETELDVYRVYTSSENLTLTYNPSSCSDCEPTTSSVCGFIKDHNLGFIGYAATHVPDSITAQILSGYRSDEARNIVEVDEQFLLPVAALAVSLVPTNKTFNCGEEGIISMWGEDMSVTSDDTLSRIVVEYMLQNPLGLQTQGAFYALNFMREMRLWPK